MLDALDAAVQAHVAKLFNVLIIDPNDSALQRFEIGIGNCLEAYDRLHNVICAKCEE
jgi:hypothetical protein